MANLTPTPTQPLINSELPVPTPGGSAGTWGAELNTDTFQLLLNWITWLADHAGALDDLTDVDTTTVAPTDRQALVWDDTASLWIPATIADGSAGVTINPQTSTAYTLTLDDADKLVTLDNGSAITLTVPLDSAVAFPVGTVIALTQLGAGLVSIAGSASVTINGVAPGADALTGQYATASLTKLATDTWLLAGGIA